MKRKIFLLILSCLFVFSISCNFTTNPCSTIKEKNLKETLRIDFDSLIEKNEIKGANLCQVIIKRGEGFNIFYVYPDGKTFIFGEIYKDGIFLSKAATERLYEKVFQNLKTEIDKIVAFSYTPEGANKYIYMITDPDCPFCEKAKYAIKQWADSKKVEVKVIFLPLEKIHPYAKDKAVKAICHGMNYEDYLNSKWEGQKCDEGIKKIEDSIAFMQKIYINATPSFVSFNGKRVTGFSPEGLDSIIK